ncbi:MAG: transcriptional initiation protein Tat [Acidiphilium sp.]|nr:transcriptional initiation protein Tat [Acidiphilium sp.]MDD4935494.1 transcriptional initiation protein Tat [Acidiphilium sp.]
MAVTAAPIAARAATVDQSSLVSSGAATLKDLLERLAKAPHRRDFKTVPMILTDKNDWDSEAIQELIDYKGEPKQVWDNTGLAGPWLNLMRNAVNVQIYSFKKPDFLAVSVTHALAHLALFNQELWDKYQLAKLTEGKFTRNSLIDTPPAASTDPKNFNDINGIFSPNDNSLTVLQRRGVVFMGCHNAIWELTGKLLKKGINPDKLSHNEIAAEFTNHLIPGVILTPGVVATMLYLQRAGYEYAK